MTNEYPTVTVGGAAIRRYQTLLSAVADEYHIEHTDRGFSTRVVDPANVQMVKATVDPEITGSYPEAASEVQRIGVSDAAFKRAVSPAYKQGNDGRGDPVEILFNEEYRRVNITVEGDRDGYQITHETTFTSIDPNSMRQQPDLPDMNLPVTARVPREAFIEATADARTEADAKYVKLSTDGDALVITAEGDTDEKSVTIPGVAEGSEGLDSGSLLSCDKVNNVRKVVKDTKPDKVTVRVGDEFPVAVGMEWPQLGLEAEYQTAPRIASN